MAEGAPGETQGVKQGRMFGAPAWYVGGRMFAVLLGDAVGLKLGETLTAALIQTGRAEPFEPGGMARMRGWARLPADPVRLEAEGELVRRALAFAGEDSPVA